MPPVTFPSASGTTSEAPRIVAVIPARFQSSRLPAKPLADIAGRPMIEHVYRRAAAARGIDAVMVATDDERIAVVVEQFGGVAVMTGTAHRTGTDRVAEVAAGLTCDVIINVQGDLPLLEPAMLTELIQPLIDDTSVNMSTLRSAADEADYLNPNVVKVVVDGRGDALYFSRAAIPYFRAGPGDAGHFSPTVVSGFSRTWKHIGLYAYRRNFLMAFAALPQTPLEQAESLEQLRALEHGFRIRAIETRYTTIEVDTPDDLERVRRVVEGGLTTSLYQAAGRA